MSYFTEKPLSPKPSSTDPPTSSSHIIGNAPPHAIHPHSHTAEDGSLVTTNPALSASQSSLRSAPDYDSSATLSADEGPDSSTKHEPGVRQYAGQKRTYEASGMNHGERDLAPAPKSSSNPGSMACVRDIINSAIERNLVGSNVPHSTAEDLRTSKFRLYHY